jgi:hypothetical protein
MGCTAAKDSSFMVDGNDFGCVGSGGYTLDFSLELTFEG